MATSGPRRCNICNVLASSCAPFPTVSLLAQPRKEEGGRPRDCNLSTTDRAENENLDPPIWMGTITIQELAKSEFSDRVPASGEG